MRLCLSWIMSLSFVVACSSSSIPPPLLDTDAGGHDPWICSPTDGVPAYACIQKGGPLQQLSLQCGTEVVFPMGLREKESVSILAFASASDSTLHPTVRLSARTSLRSDDAAAVTWTPGSKSTPAPPFSFTAPTAATYYFLVLVDDNDDCETVNLALRAE